MCAYMYDTCTICILTCLIFWYSAKIKVNVSYNYVFSMLEWHIFCGVRLRLVSENDLFKCWSCSEQVLKKGLPSYQLLLMIYVLHGSQIAQWHVWKHSRRKINLISFNKAYLLFSNLIMLKWSIIPRFPLQYYLF